MSDQSEPPLYNEEDACPPGTLGAQTNLGEIPLLPDLDFPPDPRLVAQGWERRFMADPIRAQEATRLYTELGFEVRAEAIEPSELSLACGDCRVATCRAYVTIYTRKQPSHRVGD